jgi:hypothetical protein
VSRSVRKKPGSTIVVWMPNGSTSNRNDSIHPCLSPLACRCRGSERY